MSPQSFLPFLFACFYKESYKQKTLDIQGSEEGNLDQYGAEESKLDLRIRNS